MKHFIILCSLLYLAFDCPVWAVESKETLVNNERTISSDLDKIWNDPIFQKQFIASYGINSEVEPRISQEELTLLDKVRPLMGENIALAEETIKKKIKSESSAILDFTLAGIQFQMDKMDESLANYQLAVNKFPSFRRAWRNLGLIQARNGKYDEAIDAFTRLIELGGGDAYSYGLLGYAYAYKQDYQAAEASYRNALLLQPDNTEWRLGVTRCVLKQQKYEDAATQLEVLITRFPGNADFWMIQAQAYLGLKQPLKAAQNLESINILDKGTVDSLYTLGNIYLSENLLDLSQHAFITAFEKFPEQPVARPIQIAEAFASKGAFTYAKQTLEQILKIWADDLTDIEKKRLLKIESKICAAENRGSTETAKILEEIVKIDPLDGEALILLGQHHLRKGESDRAIFYFERAESLEAFEANAKIRHAQILVEKGHYADALPLLRRVQEIKPNDDILGYLKQIERLARSDQANGKSGQP